MPQLNSQGLAVDPLPSARPKVNPAGISPPPAGGVCLSQNLGPPMSIETLKELLPDYARDLKLNLSSLASDT